MIFYVGDIHGIVQDIVMVDRQAAEDGATHVIQVGDFGARWGGDPCKIHKYFSKRPEGAPIWVTCGGNHDNWDKWVELAEKQGNPDLVELAPGCFWVQRGAMLTLEGKKHVFLGGAESVDRHHRTEGKSWWRNETPSYQEFSLFAERLETEKPDVVVTHDAPLRVPMERYARADSPTPRNLDNAVKLCGYEPPIWYFGHHHVTTTWDILGTKYQCCGFDGQFIRGE